MAKKRKSVASRLDEVDRSMYTTFCSAANSLSQLYTQSMNHQRLSFQAGERHALEKLYQWILRQQEEGSRVATVDVVAYLQNELEYGTEEPAMSPRMPFQHQQHSQTATYLNNIGSPVSSNPSSPAIFGPAVRPGDPQPKNSVFSNALSSPVRRSLQNYQLTQGSYHSNNVFPGNGPRNNETNCTNQQNREGNSTSSNDPMDMHADSPGQYFPF
ncbi:hypothetical protein SLEP1_g8570 [Rubroshorea leprosula]|uniref:Holocarboxylase synthetase n=1 Tax=Rubroshorea leprosula TaxID=152421 RepID=A0AAV5IBD8_9ROSI|nr:hypothetical protein SLEP1_g8570 [Rubroshorea leprosula]